MNNILGNRAAEFDDIVEYTSILNNLISIDDLSVEDVRHLILKAISYSAIDKSHYPPILKNKTIINLFLENSTRTRLSFEMATYNLGGNVINMTLDGSSINKGEVLKDTVLTLNAMHPDLLVVRNSKNNTAKDISKYMDCPIINAGDGSNEHPTQALLDAATIYQNLGDLEGLKVAICGDVKHSRVAGSNVKLLRKMGAEVRLIGPEELLPKNDLELYTDFAEGVKDVDIIMMLRIQKERLEAELSITEQEFHDKYGLNAVNIKFAKPDVYVMHPGPMNRGVEISSDIADNEAYSLILKQVEMGVYMRMAILDSLS